MSVATNIAEHPAEDTLTHWERHDRTHRSDQHHRNGAHVIRCSVCDALRAAEQAIAMEQERDQALYEISRLRGEAS